MNGLLTGKSHAGWKAIARRLGLRDVRAARRWARKFGIPVLKMGRTVVLDEDMYLLWYRENIILHHEKTKGIRERLAEGGKGR